MPLARLKKTSTSSYAEQGGAPFAGDEMTCYCICMYCNSKCLDRLEMIPCVFIKTKHRRQTVFDSDLETDQHLHCGELDQIVRGVIVIPVGGCEDQPPPGPDFCLYALPFACIYLLASTTDRFCALKRLLSRSNDTGATVPPAASFTPLVTAHLLLPHTYYYDIPTATIHLLLLYTYCYYTLTATIHLLLLHTYYSTSSLLPHTHYSTSSALHLGNVVTQFFSLIIH